MFSDNHVEFEQIKETFSMWPAVQQSPVCISSPNDLRRASTPVVLVTQAHILKISFRMQTKLGAPFMRWNFYSANILSKKKKKPSISLIY